MTSSPSPHEQTPGEDLAAVVDRVARHLPAQGPISVFIHHNTLHAFEDRPFEEAVVEAGRIFGCEPFLAEDAYRAALRAGRIHERDLDAMIADELGARGAERLLGRLTRRELWRRVLIHGVPEASGIELAWILRETDALERPRDDLPIDARSLARGTDLERLFRVCQEAVARSGCAPQAPFSRRARLRDVVLAASGHDVDAWIGPVLIRYVGAYLDQGFAHWAMPSRDEGLHACFAALFGRSASRLSGAWAQGLQALIADDRAAGRGGVASLAHSLEVLGVSLEEREPFLLEEALWLRGWAGMVRQLETRPDRAPALRVPARLVDHLAVQLLLSRAALAHALDEAGLDVPLAELRAQLGGGIVATPAPGVDERAWSLFHVAQLCGLSTTRLEAASATEVAALEGALGELDELARRRIFHLAFERRFRHRLYDALAQHVLVEQPSRPLFQAIFCLDDREESFRRHLEEVEPRVETLATAGFHGVAMYHQPAHAAHARPLCPGVITPTHFVAEVEEDRHGLGERLREARRHLQASVDKNLHVGSRTLSRGAVITAFLGALWVVPLVLRVVFPWFRRGLSRLQGTLTAHSTTRLALDRTDAIPPLGAHVGFTVEEMADIVQGQLIAMGITGRLAPLVFAFGHGSTSLNNPQESAYDCGACGGGQGGPNARAFAQMANDPRVRERLAALEVSIPATTWFVGGQRNTANNDVDLFDLDRVPEAWSSALRDAMAVLEIARRREAHERCRRFAIAPPPWLPDAAALVHVQGRATDLAQPRTECGHATNAACLVGRRARTRGLFLDRRVFLTSYDPTSDAEGTILAALLRAVVPVCVGINLEYFFGYVDPTGYGCGTKLPHNVTSLLGVMDGSESDLRTGLPWQMLEIHEPVRLTLVVETTPELFRRVLDADRALAGLVARRWLYVALLDPAGGTLSEVDPSLALHPYETEQDLAAVRGCSRDHYAGHDEHLEFVAIEPLRGDAA